MTAREKLHLAYEIAFYPPRLNIIWNRLKRNELEKDLNKEKIGELIDMALLLHQALPEDGYSSSHALKRLALYQAKSRAFGMVRFLRNIREYLGRSEIRIPYSVPGEMVRDIGLPSISRKFKS